MIEPLHGRFTLKVAYAAFFFFYIDKFREFANIMEIQRL